MVGEIISDWRLNNDPDQIMYRKMMPYLKRCNTFIRGCKVSYARKGKYAYIKHDRFSTDAGQGPNLNCLVPTLYNFPLRFYLSPLNF